MAPLMVGDLSKWRYRIQSNLTPTVARRSTSHSAPPCSLLTRPTIDALNSFFRDLAETTVTPEILRTSGVHHALAEIAEPGGGWPEGLARLAEGTLDRWEAALRKDHGGKGGRSCGSGLRDLIDGGRGVWSDGRRMASVKRVRKRRSTGEGFREGWLVGGAGAMGTGSAMHIGHLGFEVGDWWVELVAAFRSGIISPSECGITTRRSEAVAIVLTADEEVATGGHVPSFSSKGSLGLVDLGHRVQYRPRKKCRGQVKLLRNLVTRNPVRLLRHHELLSPLRPQAGVRYDGLYKVTGWSVQLVGDDWQFTFQLERLEGQLGLEKALSRPNSKELADWEECQREKDEQTEDITEAQRDDDVIVWDAEEESEFAENHSQSRVEHERIKVQCQRISGGPLESEKGLGD